MKLSIKIRHFNQSRDCIFIIYLFIWLSFLSIFLSRCNKLCFDELNADRAHLLDVFAISSFRFKFLCFSKYLSSTGRWNFFPIVNGKYLNIRVLGRVEEILFSWEIKQCDKCIEYRLSSRISIVYRYLKEI